MLTHLLRVINAAASTHLVYCLYFMHRVEGAQFRVQALVVALAAPVTPAQRVA